MNATDRGWYIVYIKAQGTSKEESPTARYNIEAADWVEAVVVCTSRFRKAFDEFGVVYGENDFSITVGPMCGTTLPHWRPQ